MGYLMKYGFVWSEHQKRRSTSGRLLPTGRKNVYIHSTLDWQKDDIELAIGSYVDDMSKELYETISEGRIDFLKNHKWFGEDITQAVERLENML